MSKTEIKKCSCVSEYQNDKYGKDNRVHNLLGKAGKSASKGTSIQYRGSRCTVCGNVKSG